MDLKSEIKGMKEKISEIEGSLFNREKEKKYQPDKMCCEKLFATTMQKQTLSLKWESGKLIFHDTFIGKHEFPFCPFCGMKIF